MSVEHYGARLLSEVHEESLDQLLAKIRTSYRPLQTNVFGLSQLDRLLEIFRRRQADTRGHQFDWLTQPPTDLPSEDEFVDSPQRYSVIRSEASFQQKPSIIEVTSQRSAVGKTTLLYHLTGLAVLPRKYGGKESTVVWLDTDNRFSVQQLSNVVRSHLSRIYTTVDPEFCSNIIKQNLNHVHIYQPRSSTQVVQVLEKLPEYLLDSKAHYSSSRTLSLLILDSATAFHWQDRFDQDMARIEAGPDGNPDTSKSYNGKINQTTKLLKAIQTQFDCTIIFTTDPLTNPLPRRNRQSYPSNNTTSTNPNPFSANLEPDEAVPISPWTAFATMTVTMSRLAVPQFAPNMTIEECLRDREKRQEAAAKNRVVVQPDWSRSDRWDRGVKETIMALDGRGAFVVGLGAGGVVVV